MSGTVRVANTVRRTAGPWTPTIHRLLRHLHASGVAWVPRPLGMTDEPQAREVLTFVPGTVPQDPMPPWVWTDAVLIDAAARLSALHGAGCDFDAAGGCWQVPVHAPAEVICHNDFAALQPRLRLQPRDRRRHRRGHRVARSSRMGRCLPRLPARAACRAEEPRLGRPRRSGRTPPSARAAVPDLRPRPRPGRRRGDGRAPAPRARRLRRRSRGRGSAAPRRPRTAVPRRRRLARRFATGASVTLAAQLRSSSATHSMCGVCGNMSTGRTRRSS
jgi:hypothetical protein